jgi:hypothetical protein
MWYVISLESATATTRNPFTTWSLRRLPNTRTYEFTLRITSGSQRLTPSTLQPKQSRAVTGPEFGSICQVFLILVVDTDQTRAGAVVHLEFGVVCALRTHQFTDKRDLRARKKQPQTNAYQPLHKGKTCLSCFFAIDCMARA